MTTRHRLMYQQAASNFTQALPFGNGSFGGMVYGGVPKEKITLNLDTLWSGTGTKSEAYLDEEVLEKSRALIFNGHYHQAQEYVRETMLGFFNESYMPLATLEYEYLGIKDSINYKQRELDLMKGIISTQFDVNDDEVKSQLFSSNKKDAIFLTINASSRILNVRFNLSSLLKHSVNNDGTELILKGVAPSHVEPNYVECAESIFYDPKESGMLFQTNLHIHTTDGQVSGDSNDLIVKNASRIVVVLVADNGYQGYNKPLTFDDEYISDLCYSKYNKVRNLVFEELVAEHIDDFKGLMSRVDFYLGDDQMTEYPTDYRMQRLKKGEIDRDFFTLYFQFGRYLMVSSSRKGSQPANLQGIWNEEVRPPWSANYTTNINVEMNYWMVNSGNLKECFEPYIRMLKELSDRGSETAEKQYHCDGWAANHNVDLWRQSNPVAGLPKYAYWPMGGVWLSSHLYDYYQYTMDLSYLENEAYPIIEGCVRFCLDWLVKGEDGLLHTCPSTSPENVFYDEENNVCSVSYSSTMDISLLVELFGNYLKMSNMIKVDERLLNRVKEAIEKLPKLQIDEKGCLQEWIKPFKEVEVGHRHLSPLYGFHPANNINDYKNPELVEACRKFLMKRVDNGGGQVGWSCAWLINLFARFRDVTLAYRYLNELVTNSSYDNLFDLHPPLGEAFEGEKEVFQIDGNFGGVAGILEMLVQSHREEIELLPCLPIQWSEGRIEGVMAYGGVELSIWWNEGVLTKAVLKSKTDSLLKVKYKKQLILKNNSEWTYTDDGCIVFKALRNRGYELLG